MMKAKNVIEKAKVTAMCAVPAIMACPLVAHAAGEATDAGSLADQAGQVLTTAIGDMTTSISNSIMSMLPVAVPIIAIGLVVTVGVKVFKRIANLA